MKVNPLIIDGTLYGLNPQLKLFALDAATGEEKWVYDPVSVPLRGKNVGRGNFASSTKISRGISFYRGSATDQRIIYAPGGGHALYCVNALTGKLITSFGDNGIVDLHDGLDWTPPPAGSANLKTVQDFHISMTSPGIIYRDLIIVGRGYQRDRSRHRAILWRSTFTQENGDGYFIPFLAPESQATRPTKTKRPISMLEEPTRGVV